MACLEAVADKPEGAIGLSEVSSKTGLDKATAQRILRSMVELGYAEYVARERGYRLTAKMLTVASAALRRRFSPAKIKEVMALLSREFGETVNLGVLNGDQVVYVDKIESTYLIRADLSSGMMVPVWCTGLGKAILAFRPDLVSEMGSRFRAFTNRSHASLEALHEDLANTRNRGFAIDDEEYISGLRCVAVPVLTEDGLVTSSVSVTGPASRMTLRHITQIGERMHFVSQAILRSN